MQLALAAKYIGAGIATLALAGAVLLEGVLRRFQGDVVVGSQQQVVAGFDVAAAHQEVAVFTTAGGDQVEFTFYGN